MELKFRTLKPSEIDCRIAQIAKSGSGMFLLYKDARVDMRLLDEVVGPMNWKREHSRDNANCIVSIWDDVKGQWVSKEDTGTESSTEQQKGLASDSFKRACFNWGIGRELYTAPQIWVKPNEGEDIRYLKLRCTKIEYNDEREVSALELVDGNGEVRYKFPFGKSSQKPAQPKQAESATLNTQQSLDFALILDQVKQCQTVEEITKLWKELTEWQSNGAFRAACTKRKDEIQAKAA